MLRRENHLDRQRRSRERLDQAVRDYVMLRKADGGYDTVVHTVDGSGRKVAVFVNLNIISEED